MLLRDSIALKLVLQTKRVLILSKHKALCIMLTSCTNNGLTLCPGPSPHSHVSVFSFFENGVFNWLTKETPAYRTYRVSCGIIMPSLYKGNDKKNNVRRLFLVSSVSVKSSSRLYTDYTLFFLDNQRYLIFLLMEVRRGHQYKKRNKKH